MSLHNLETVIDRTIASAVKIWRNESFGQLYLENQDTGEDIRILTDSVETFAQEIDLDLSDVSDGQEVFYEGSFAQWAWNLAQSAVLRTGTTDSMAQALRDQLIISYSEKAELWDWETDDFCSEEVGFDTKEEARADFE